MCVCVQRDRERESITKSKHVFVSKTFAPTFRPSWGFFKVCPVGLTVSRTHARTHARTYGERGRGRESLHLCINVYFLFFKFFYTDNYDDAGSRCHRQVHRAVSLRCAVVSTGRHWRRSEKAW